MAHVDLRTPPPRPARSPLWQLNAALTRPAAALFGVLGIAPGQLSLQSVTLTVVGLLRAAGGGRAEVLQGVLLVYAGLLLDRADELLANRGKAATAWGRFLGQFADRIVEAALVLALAWLHLRGTTPTGPLATGPYLGVVAALLAGLFLARSATATGDLLILRQHLVQARRLPGPATLAPPGLQPRLSRWLDRDAFVAIWCLGVALGFAQVAALALLAMQAALLIEAIVVFWARSKDPEAHAATLLVRGP